MTDRKPAQYRLKVGKMGEVAVGAHNGIANTVVGTYKKIETSVVDTYQKIEDGFVDRFLEPMEPDDAVIDEHLADGADTSTDTSTSSTQ